MVRETCITWRCRDEDKSSSSGGGRTLEEGQDFLGRGRRAVGALLTRLRPPVIYQCTKHEGRSIPYILLINQEFS